MDDKLMADNLVDPRTPSESSVQRDSQGKAVSDRSSGTYKLPDDELIARVNKWYSESVQFEGNDRVETEEDFSFVAGHQWQQKIANQMQADKRPALTLNHIQPTVNTLTGEERLNRQDIKYYARDDSDIDSKRAHAFNELTRWSIDQCDGDYEISKAFRDAAIGGQGWLHVRLSVEDDPEGMVVIEHVDWREMRVDPVCRKENLKDGRRLQRERWLTEDEILAAWPGKLEDIEFMKDGLGGTGDVQQVDRPPGDQYRDGSGSFYEPKKGTFRVIESHWFEWEAGYVVEDPFTGQIVELRAKEYEQLKEDKDVRAKYEVPKREWDLIKSRSIESPSGRLISVDNNPQEQAILDKGPPEVLKGAKAKIRFFYKAWTIGPTLLQKAPYDVRHCKLYAYQRICGLWDDDKKRWYGIVRGLKDPQRMYNVGISSMLEWIQRAPMNGWIGPRGSFVDIENWKNNSAKSGFIGQYRQDKNKPELVKPPALPRHMVDLPAVMLESIRQISGVNAERSGTSKQDIAGVLFERRVNRAMAVTQTFFDNQRLCRRQLGRLIGAYCQHYLTDGRKIRVLGEGKAEYVEATADLKALRFDTVVEDSPEQATEPGSPMHP